MSPRSVFAWTSLWASVRTALRRLFRGPRRPSWPFVFEAAVETLRLVTRRFEAYPPALRREAWDQNSLPLPADVHKQLELVGGVLSAWLRPAAPTGRVVLFFHGGAYLWGSITTHQAVLAEVVRRSGAQIVVPAYRLAPESPFPAALNDAIQAYRGLLDAGLPASEIVVAGDSAGGGLSAALMLSLAELGLPRPRGLALLCPWVDLVPRGGSLNEAADDWGDRALAEAWTASYLAGADPRDPRASPRYGDLSCLPRTLLQVGSAEILRDQVRALAQAAQALHVPLVLSEYPDMVHNWHFHFRYLPAARAALDEIAAFVRE